MRAVVQRVLKSQVTVDSEIVGSINKGLLVFLGISKEDTDKDLEYIKDKVVNLRIFEDEEERMNRSLLDEKGELMIVSQFTLYGDVRKGKRPSFTEALNGELAEKIYEKFILECKKENIKVATGKFGADMKVLIDNDGPVTILIDSKKTF